MLSMNDLIPYLELHKNLREKGRETILNHELEEKEKEFVGQQIRICGTISELDPVRNEMIITYLSDSTEGRTLIENKMVSHYYFVFCYSADLQNLTEKIKMEVDDLVSVSGVIISLHRNSIMRILASEASIIKKRQGHSKMVKKKGCFIATAVYGSEDAKEVRRFYQFRDQRLAPTFFGRLLILVYYRFSPPLANWLKGRPNSRRFVKKYILDRILDLIDF
jgi:hypothetical protein